MTEMSNVLEYLRENDFELDNSSIIKDDDGTITHIYTGKDDLYFVIIAPHEGNDFKYLLRVNPKKTFDRWSVCDWDRSFPYAYQLVEYLEENMLKIYQDILEIYIDYYWESEYFD